MRLGIPLFEGYGLSECCSVVALNRPGATRAGSVGQPLEGLRVQIEDGEIVVEGPSLMDGYLHEDSLPPFRWRTGDLGCLDKDGFLTVYGRRDNLIITPSGRNINPEWVETTLLDEANIAACVVGPIGEPMELSVLLIPSEAAAGWATNRLAHRGPWRRRAGMSWPTIICAPEKCICDFSCGSHDGGTVYSQWPNPPSCRARSIGRTSQNSQSAQLR